MPTTPLSIHKTRQVAATVLHFTFSEGTGTSLADASGTGNTGTLAASPNTPSWVTTGRHLNALSFDRTNNNRVTVNDATSLNPSNITLMAWVNLGANNDFGMIISKLPSSGVSGYELRTDGTTDKPSVVMGMVTGGQKVISGTVAIAQNTWHWWVATYDGTTLRLYVDAAEVASVGVTNDTIASNSLPLWLGMRTTPAITNPLAGRLDDVQIRNTAMTAADIAAEFQRLTRVAFLG